MNSWQKYRRSSGWGNGIIDWEEGNNAYLSVVFSWQLPQAYQRAAWYKAMGHRVRAGGPAVAFNPAYLAGVAEVGLTYPDAVAKHNPKATFTQRGCIRKCSFCIVPEIETMGELDDWPVRPIVCDNNFLACSDVHFNRVIDRLKPLKTVDFNQGLDARLLTKERANRLAEIDMKVVRLAWDNTGMERAYLRAVQLLIDAGFAKNVLRTYALIGFMDTQEDALYRLETIRDLGIWPNPMRYQPLDSLRKNSYAGPHWTDTELKRFMRYWANLRYTRAIPFSEFAHGGQKPSIYRQNQPNMLE